MLKLVSQNPWLFVENEDLILMTGIDTENRFFQKSKKFPKTGEEQLLIYEYQVLGHLVLVRFKSSTCRPSVKAPGEPSLQEVKFNSVDAETKKLMMESYWHEPKDWALKLQLLVLHPEEVSSERLKKYVELMIYDYRVQLAPFLDLVKKFNLMSLFDENDLFDDAVNCAGVDIDKLQALVKVVVSFGLSVNDVKARVRAVQQMEFFLGVKTGFPFERKQFN